MMEKGETMEKATPNVLATVRAELAYRAHAKKTTDRAALHRALDAALDADDRKICYKCNGSGQKAPGKKCIVCSGTGKISPKSKTVYYQA